MFEVKTLVSGTLEVNTYVVFGARKNKCFVIDPGEVEPILAFMEENRLKCTHILLTHGHFDHLKGVCELKEATKAKILIHEADAVALYDERASLSTVAGVHIAPAKADKLLCDGDIVKAAGFTIRVIHTPGHSPGCVCFLLENERAIFTGDTLFRLNVGCCDFFHSDEDVMMDSIKNKLFTLEGDYDIYPGHMRKSTLDFEREKNPFVNRGRRLA